MQLTPHLTSPCSLFYYFFVSSISVGARPGRSIYPALLSLFLLVRVFVMEYIYPSLICQAYAGGRDCLLLRSTLVRSVPTYKEESNPSVPDVMPAILRC